MTTSTGDIFATSNRQDFEFRLSKYAELMGLDLIEQGLTIPFFNRIYRITPETVEDIHGSTPTEAVRRVLCRYILQYPQLIPPDGQKVTFREFSGAAPLVSSFARNTNKLIANTFRDSPAILIVRADRLNGETRVGAEGWDVSVRFRALPNVPMFLQFNAADAHFPAQCSLLFFQSAVLYLDMESLFVLGTWLAGHLIADEEV